MAEVFKWYFGIVAIIILIYVLIVVVRSLASYTTNLAHVATTTATNTVSTSTFSTTTLFGIIPATIFKNFHPFQFAPISVVPNISAQVSAGVQNDTKANYDYMQNAFATPFTDSLINSYSKMDAGGQDFDSRWGTGAWDYSKYENAPNYVNSKVAVNTSLKPNQEVRDYDVITGKTYYGNFSQDGTFPIYVLDENKVLIGSSKGFVNGQADRDGNISWRGVLNFQISNTNTGYVVLNNTDVIPVTFKFYRTRYNFNNMPKLLFPSQNINSHSF